MTSSKKKYLILSILLLIISAMSMTCFTNEIKITDILGREVSVPADINRILAVGSSLREIVLFGVTDKIVGIEYREKSETDEKGAPQGSDLPYMLAFPQLYDLPVVNVGVGGSGFNHELIIGLDPDIIFIGASGAEKVNDLSNKTNIPVIALYTDPIGTAQQDKLFYDSLKIIGATLGKIEQAEEIIEIIEGYYQDLWGRTENISEDEKKNAYIGGRAFFGSHGITGTDPQWPPFNLVNVKNVASELSDLSSGVSIDREALIGWNPDVIFFSPVSLPIIESELTSTPFNSLKAVQDKKVYSILPYCWYAYNKENAIADAYFVGKILYPEAFDDIDIDEKSIEIYKKFYKENGEDVYYKLKERFGAFINY
ncbi:MAG: ABC transporter substrate-binding protein [Atribacterota bacterium]|nr:ABC transporter substrate-binding protein [Atribacterota bacterium]